MIIVIVIVVKGNNSIVNIITTKTEVVKVFVIESILSLVNVHLTNL